MKIISLALVGPGKIATDQHLPSISRNRQYRLDAIVSRRGVTVDGVPVHASLGDLLAAQPYVQAVAFCTPPQGRHADVAMALKAGKHVLIEKPPTTTLSELHDLENLARLTGSVLFATWHCQFNPSVETVREMLARDGVSRLDVTWRESVWKWHPGQDWIWETGGFGVFDPGINALSILTAILPFPIFVQRARFEVPANRQMPIAANLSFASDNAIPMEMHMDWRERGGDVWDIEIRTGAGQQLRISRGGGELRVDNVLVHSGPKKEYDGIYARFAELIQARRSQVDAAPLRLVADAFLLAERQGVAPFDWADQSASSGSGSP